MAENPGILRPEIDARTGAQTNKIVSRASTYGRTAFFECVLDAPANSTVIQNLQFPFQIDLVEGILLDGTGAGDEARCEAAPGLDLKVVVGGVDVLLAPIAIGDEAITIIPLFLDGFVNKALIDSGLFEITIEEGATVEGPYLVTGYDLATGIVSLWDQIEIWNGATGTDGLFDPVTGKFIGKTAWTGFANAFTVAAKVRVTRVLFGGDRPGGLAQLPGGEVVKLGNYGLDSAPIAAYVPITVTYKNINAVTAREVKLLWHVYTGVPPVP